MVLLEIMSLDTVLRRELSQSEVAVEGDGQGRTLSEYGIT